VPWPCLVLHTNWRERERSKDQVDLRRPVPVLEEHSNRRAERRLDNSGRKLVEQTRRRALGRSRRRKRELVEHKWALGRRPELAGRTRVHTTEVQLVHMMEPVGRMRALGRRKGPVGRMRALGHRQELEHK